MTASGRAGPRPDLVERWRIGDSAVRAKRKGPHGLAQYAERTGRELSTIRGYARVASAVPARHRGYPHLSWSHYEAVAARPDRFELLERASSERWTVGRLKAEVASISPPQCSDPDVRQMTPQVLDQALDYCNRLAAGSRDEPPRFGAPLRDRLVRLARLAGDLAGVTS